MHNTRSSRPHCIVSVNYVLSSNQGALNGLESKKKSTYVCLAASNKAYNSLVVTTNTSTTPSKSTSSKSSDNSSIKFNEDNSQVNDVVSSSSNCIKADNEKVSNIIATKITNLSTPIKQCCSPSTTTTDLLITSNKNQQTKWNASNEYTVSTTTKPIDSLINHQTSIDQNNQWLNVDQNSAFLNSFSYKTKPTKRNRTVNRKPYNGKASVYKDMNNCKETAYKTSLNLPLNINCSDVQSERWSNHHHHDYVPDHPFNDSKTTNSIIPPINYSTVQLDCSDQTDFVQPSTNFTLNLPAQFQSTSSPNYGPINQTYNQISNGGLDSTYIEASLNQFLKNNEHPSDNPPFNYPSNYSTSMPYYAHNAHYSNNYTYQPVCSDYYWTG